MKLLKEIEGIQTKLVDLWHQETPLVNKKGFLSLMVEEHLQNYLLWHEEEIARKHNVSNSELARVKESKNRLNLRRSQLIIKLDEAILTWMSGAGIQIPDGAPLNSETPGSMIDRCSIFSLKIFHMRALANRLTKESEDLQLVVRKLGDLVSQRKDLFQCLFELIEAVQQGTRRFYIYSQFNMRNDLSSTLKIHKTKISTL